MLFCQPLAFLLFQQQLHSHYEQQQCPPVLKGLAYPVNGIIMGGLDWRFTMIAMWAANFVCVGMIKFWSSGGGGALVSLSQIWWALAAFMGTQVITGVLRFQSKTGVWRVLRGKESSV